MDIELLKKTIGRKLKQARKDNDLTQDDVAAKLDISAVAYGSFERGTNLIGLNYLIEISRIFSKPLGDFLPGYLTPEELNDLSHHPLFQRLLTAFAALPDDDARLVFVNAMEILTRKRDDSVTES